MRTTVSRLPAATSQPLGEIATEVTPASALSDAESLMARTVHDPSLISQTRAVLSPEPETISRPSLEKAKE